MWWFNDILIDRPIQKRTLDLLEVGDRVRYYFELENQGVK